MSKHLTGRFWFCAVIAWGGVLTSLVVKELEPMMLGLPFLWAIALSLIDGWWPLASVTLLGLSSERIIEGDELHFDLEIRSDRSVGWLELELQLQAGLAPVDPLRIVSSTRAGIASSIRFSMRADRWGGSVPEWLTVVARDRFGMTERVQHVPIAHRARVHPPTERLQGLVPLTVTRQVTGDHRSIRRGSGSELAVVRSYRSGDPVRMIHTRLSSRRGTPMVLERHPDESADIVIFVDSVQDVGAGMETSLRWTVTAAIALTQRHLRSMDRVGILDRGAGVRWLPPELGRRALHTIVDALLSTAVLRPRSIDGNSVPIDRIPTGATIFCISPLLSEVVHQDLAILRRRGHEVIVIQPNAADSASPVDVLARRLVRVNTEIRRRSLSDQGVIVIPWDPREPLDPTLQLMGRHLGRFRGSL